MSWKRAMAAGAKQQAITAAQKPSRGAKKTCAMADCDNMGTVRLKGKLYCKDCADALLGNT